MSGNPKVALLIDADNVSIDVIEQAVAHLLAEHGALHVRRAYGTAESAVKHQAVFKRLGIRPMVNLATGKNSTDIALAVDAMDLAIAERPDVMAIASSDSDFAPLVARLREKGCRVVGLGQAGKTGDETIGVYDVFTVLVHRKGGAASAGGSRGSARGSAGKARKSAAAAAPAPEASAEAPSPASAPAAATAGAVEPAPAATAPRKTTRRKSTAKTASKSAGKTTTKTGAPAPAPSSSASASAATPDRLRQVLAALPELEAGKTVELRLAAERLRDAGLITRSGTSTRVFGAFPERFELLPEKNPNKVRLRP